MLIDSHCHLTDPGFDPDRGEVLERARGTGVEAILSVSSDRADAGRVRRLVAENRAGGGAPGIWGTAGIHPHQATAAGDEDLDAMRALFQEEPRLVAVGETGLDFHYEHSPRPEQTALFRGHLELAGELGAPVVVHSRSADQAMMELIREWGSRVQGVLHCFTGERELLETALRAGWMVSFTGIVTFRRYEGAGLVRSVPRDRLMVETDAPYLAPAPRRGKRNEPALVSRIVEALATLRGEHPQELAAYTGKNARSFFRMED